MKCKQNPIPTNKTNHVWRKYSKAHWYQLEGNINIRGIEKNFQFPRTVEEDRWRASSQHKQLHVGGKEEHTAANQCQYRAEGSRMREEIPLLKREVGTVQQWGETKGFTLVAVGWYNLAKIRRWKKSQKVMGKDTVAKFTVNWAGRHCKGILWGHNRTVQAVLKEFRLKPISS